MVCPTGLEGVSFFSSSPNVSDFDMWHTNPLNSHTARAPCYMCYMYYMGLTRQPAELYTIHIASQHVPNMHCIAHIVHIARSWGRVGVQRLGVSDPYSTYSTYSKEPGECGGSVGWRVR